MSEIMFGVLWRYRGGEWKWTLRERPYQVWFSQDEEDADRYAQSIRIEGTETKVVKVLMTIEGGES